MDSDDSKRLHCSATAGAASGNPATLEALGWDPFFAQQASLEALSETPPVRVVAVHRSGLQIVGVDIDEHLPPRAVHQPAAATDRGEYRHGLRCHLL
ncbi:hypothetical protein [Thiocapsa bogorovii]|uniref:hypothetical protein n=1 Tax=Thiocapsa bogorovii TaxID=521689 RepID=UPI001E5A9F29|nr:hypothetical protein [Thiocapsa bogorovii]UHD17902.1 hypothetical protein LT988_07615 [Thiocapsa bogorovii]